MIRSLELENFKAFGERAKIPFAPITLIFGENSAGKSTILQSLNLLKQTAESREVGAPLLPRAENGIVDLGSFQELLFDHDLKRTLCIRVETDVPDSFRMSRYKEKRISVEFHFKRPTIDDEVLLDQMEIYYGKPSECVAKLRRSESSLESRVRLANSISQSSGASPELSELTFVKCVWMTKSAQYWEPEFEWCKENLENIRTDLSDNIERLEERFKMERAEERVYEEDSSIEGIRGISKITRMELDSLSAELAFFSSEFDLEAYITKRCQEEENEEDAEFGFRGFFPVARRIPVGRRSRSNRTVSGIEDCTRAAIDTLEQTLKALLPIGPYRRPSERWNIFTGTTPQDVGYQGSQLPDLLFRHPALVKDTNKWLKRLDIDYELDVKPVGDRSRDLFEVRLIDTRRKEPVDVGLPDVGFGISQLLPFVVQSLASEGRIISIEQPEVHVHPRLQADLGDLLAEAIKEPHHNQFIIETHSEHLILRLQRLVYEERIAPEDISVIYVSRARKRAEVQGAQAQRLRLDEEGDFIDEWPNGFFPERLRELR